MTRLAVATGNPHKLAELGASLPGIELVAIATDASPPLEDGRTYAANARLKARFGREHAPPDAWAVGEDSGIEAAALGGAPGIHSARWADDGVARLLTELAEAADRSLRYVCVIVAISPEGEELVASGTLDGAAALERRGIGGFGYDPIFVPLGETRTVAELGDAWKHGHSHRARAARALADRLP
ncbi:MAG: non-canonical purine NTP pyrophosphatase [Gaiellales bacterium]